MPSSLARPVKPILLSISLYSILTAAQEENQSHKSKRSLSSGALGGIAAAGTVGGLIIIGVIIYILIRSRRRKAQLNVARDNADISFLSKKGDLETGSVNGQEKDRSNAVSPTVANSKSEPSSSTPAQVRFSQSPTTSYPTKGAANYTTDQIAQSFSPAVGKDQQTEEKKDAPAVAGLSRVAAWRHNLLRQATPTVPDSVPVIEKESEKPTVTSTQNTKADEEKSNHLAVDTKRSGAARASVATSVYHDDVTEGMSFMPGLSVVGLGPAGPAATIASTTDSLTGDLAWILTGGQVHRPQTVPQGRKAATPSICTASTAAGVAGYGIGPMSVPMPDLSLDRNNSSLTVNKYTPKQNRRPTSDALTLPSYYTNGTNTPYDSSEHASAFPFAGSPVASSAVFSIPDMYDEKSTISGMTSFMDVGVQPSLIGIGMTPSTRRRMDRNKMTFKDFDKLMMLDNVPPVPEIPDSHDISKLSPKTFVPPTPISTGQPSVLASSQLLNDSINKSSSDVGEEKKFDHVLPSNPSSSSYSQYMDQTNALSSPSDYGSQTQTENQTINSDEFMVSSTQESYQSDVLVHDDHLRDDDEVDEDHIGVHSAAVEMLAHRLRQRKSKSGRSALGPSGTAPQATNGWQQPQSTDGAPSQRPRTAQRSNVPVPLNGLKTHRPIIAPVEEKIATQGDNEEVYSAGSSGTSVSYSHAMLIQQAANARVGGNNGQGSQPKHSVPSPKTNDVVHKSSWTAEDIAASPTDDTKGIYTLLGSENTISPYSYLSGSEISPPSTFGQSHS